MLRIMARVVAQLRWRRAERSGLPFLSPTCGRESREAGREGASSRGRASFDLPLSRSFGPPSPTSGRGDKQRVLGFTIAGLIGIGIATTAHAYPVDGYAYTGIRRLDYIAGVEAGTIPGRKMAPGQYLRMEQVQPGWKTNDGKLLPDVDADFTAELSKMLKASGYGSYSVALLDLSDPTAAKYAGYDDDNKANVGSVGKVLVVLALFQTLADLYPDDIAARERVLRDTRVTADQYSQYDHHTVTFWDPATKVRKSRQIRAGDEASLWEYLDWMLSASSNSAAGMVQKELIALKHFGRAYPASKDDTEAFFKSQTGKQLGDLYLQTMDDAVLRNGLDPGQFRQGSIFTHGGKQKVVGTNSFATTEQLVRYLYRLEAGTLIDAFSSREIKRLLYMTQRRIRYASHPVLNDSAVYFKSGSFYQCKVSGTCGKYKGDKTNRLASVAMVESPAGTPRLRYLVAIHSNVLGVNSAVAHQTLALKIQRLIEARHPVEAQAPATPENAFPQVPVDDPEAGGGQNDPQ